MFPLTPTMLLVFLLWYFTCCGRQKEEKPKFPLQEYPFKGFHFHKYDKLPSKRTMVRKYDSKTSRTGDGLSVTTVF